jgi:hypothetical protein
MSNILFTEVTYPLSNLLENIDLGEIGLPEIQRPFVWPNSKVRDLFDSMYKGFPVGYLLFWVNGANGHRVIGENIKQKVARLLIVDGQQRLTSLYAVLKGIPVVRSNYKKERIYIAFRPKDQTFEVTDATTRRNPEFIPDISELWSGDKTRNRFVKDFLARLRESRPVTEAEEDHLSEAIDRLYDLQTYPFTALELSATVDEENVADVFVRINSKGTTLNQADFILTLMSVFWDQGRTDLEAFCRISRTPADKKASPYNYFIHPDPDQLLRVSVGYGFRRARLRHVYSILRGKDLETEQFSDEKRDEQFAVLQVAQERVLNLQDWHDFFYALHSAGYTGGHMISSMNALLYAYVFYLIGKCDYQVHHYILRRIIARWFFMSALTSRYSGSFESVMEQDLARLRDVQTADGFVEVLERVIQDVFTEDYWHINLVNDLETSSARTPPLFAYYAALNLIKAKVLFSNVHVHVMLDPATKAFKSAVERHHLFPRAYLKRIGLTSTRDINQVANFALVEWKDNIDIRDEPPSEYFSDYLRRYEDKPAELKELYHWHALPPGWEHMEYSEFLVERRRRMAEIIREGFDEI